MNKNKALFLDRDGVLIEETGGYNYRMDQVKMIEAIYPLLQHAQKKGYLFIMITNQGGIDKKMFGHADVHRINDFILAELEKNAIHIKSIYYCPHHSEVSLCICRKPNSGMLEKALAKYDIDATKSYMIGDHERDILAAEKAGVKGIKVEPNQTNFDNIFGIIE